MPDHAKSPVPPSEQPPLPARLTNDEREALLERVLTLRVEAGLSVVDIAQIVGRHRTTVSRLLSQVRRRLARAYQPGSRFDPSVTIAELVDRCDRVARLSMQQFQIADAPRDKLRALRTALAADLQKKTVLQEVGLLPRDLGNLQIEAGRTRASASEVRRLADQLRRMGALPSENVFDIPLTAPGEHAYLTGEVIDVNGNGADRDDGTDRDHEDDDDD